MKKAANRMMRIIPFKQAKEKLDKGRRKSKKLYECKWNAEKQRLETVSFNDDHPLPE